ncbi:MAG: dehydrogenase [Thioploca sp.]|nr:dehydrogenase [Thioploca sp.]
MTISQTNNESALLAHFRQGAAEDLRELAWLQYQELSYAVVEELKQVNFPDNLGLRLQSSESQEVLDFMRKAIAELPVPIEKKVLDDLAVDFASIYLNNNIHASPYESVWLTDDGLTRQEPMFQVRRWYEKYNLAAQNWRARPDDHLVLQLQFISHLFSLDEKLDTLKEASCFLDEHLLRWIKLFASRVASRCETPFYAGLVLLMAQYLDELRDLLAQIVDEPRPSAEEIEQRMKPKVDPTLVKFCTPRFDDPDEPVNL